MQSKKGGPRDPPLIPFYPSDLLPAMQGVLAALADLETYHEIERERRGTWAIPTLATLAEC